MAHNAAFLRQKIRILALMEMVFQRPSQDRVLSFIDIGEACDLPLVQVELLVMKALSLNLVKGIIDQVDESVQIKWVQPRVLDVAQVAQLKDRLETWTETVHQTILFI